MFISIWVNTNVTTRTWVNVTSTRKGVRFSPFKSYLHIFTFCNIKTTLMRQTNIYIVFYRSTNSGKKHTRAMCCIHSELLYQHCKRQPLHVQAAFVLISPSGVSTWQNKNFEFCFVCVIFEGSFSGKLLGVKRVKLHKNTWNHSEKQSLLEENGQGVENTATYNTSQQTYNQIAFSFFFLIKAW